MATDDHQTSDSRVGSSRTLGAVTDGGLAYLAAVVNTSADAIVSKSLDGTVTSWNASAERIFGYTAGEIVGKNIRLLIPADLHAEEDEILAKLRAGIHIEHYETVRVAKDGRQLDVSLSISPIKDQTGRIVGAAKIARDITARKQAEEVLAATNAKFESVFNQSGIFAGVLDTGGVLREINDLAVDECGYTREEVIDRPFWATLWWRGSEEVQTRIREATVRAAAGEPFRATLPYWIADGTERIVDFALHPIRDHNGDIRFLYPTGIDTTERARAEAALRAREAEERGIALELQRALLPRKLVVPAGISVAARYEAGSAGLEVGGDWYDVFELEDGRVGLTVGDVVGHGLTAAAAMGQLRTALAAMARHTESAGQLLTHLDAFIATSGATDFATVCYGALDSATGVFEYASAGHPPILLVSPTGDSRWLRDAQSPPLGGDDERRRPDARVTLEAGSLLVLYSDGLFERRGELLTDGLDRIKKTAQTLARESVAEVCNELVAALGVDVSRQDDVAVLAVRFDPRVGGSFHLSFPAEARELRALRAAIRQWLDARPVSTETHRALILAVGEACSNSIEHAYQAGDPGTVDVEVEQRDAMLIATVRDYGRLRRPPSERHADRGRGTQLIRDLTLDFSRNSTTNGTTVRFRLPMTTSQPDD